MTSTIARRSLLLIQSRHRRPLLAPRARLDIHIIFIHLHALAFQSAERTHRFRTSARDASRRRAYATRAPQWRLTPSLPSLASMSTVHHVAKTIVSARTRRTARVERGGVVARARSAREIGRKQEFAWKSLSNARDDVSETGSTRTEITASMFSTMCAVACASALAMTMDASPALAIPQTSECATNSCDDRDYHGQKLAGTGAFFTKGSLKRANFDGANLEGITFFGADLTGATFRGANLQNANLGQANLSKADLTDAILSGAIVSSAQFDDVKIEGSDWSEVIVRKVSYFAA